MSDTMIATIFTETMAKLEEAIQDGRSKEELLGLIADAREKFKSNPKPKPKVRPVSLWTVFSSKCREEGITDMKMISSRWAEWKKNNNKESEEYKELEKEAKKRTEEKIKNQNENGGSKNKKMKKPKKVATARSFYVLEVKARLKSEGKPLKGCTSKGSEAHTFWEKLKKDCKNNDEDALAKMQVYLDKVEEDKVRYEREMEAFTESSESEDLQARKVESATKIQAIVRGRAGRNVAADMRMEKWENESCGLPQELLEEEIAKGNASRCYSPAADETKENEADSDSESDSSSSSDSESESESESEEEEEKVEEKVEEKEEEKVDIDSLTPPEEFKEVEEKWNARLEKLHYVVDEYDDIDKMKKSEVQGHLSELGLTTTGRVRFLRKKLKYATGLDMDYEYDMVKDWQYAPCDPNPLTGYAPTCKFDYTDKLNRMKEVLRWNFTCAVDGNRRPMTRYRNVREMIESMRCRTGCPRIVMYNPANMDAMASFYESCFKKNMARRMDRADQMVDERD